MESELCEKQKVLISKLSDLIRNYKADGKDRKKELSYYPKKLTQLDNFWKEFDANDSEIRQVTSDKSLEYFAEEMYDRAKKIYEDQRTKILQDEEALKKKFEERNSTKKTVVEPSSSQVPKPSVIDFNSIIEMQKNDETVEQHNTDESDNETGNDFTTNDDSIPATVKVYLFLVNEIKNAISTAENITIYESQGIAAAQLENLKEIWSEFRISHREHSIGENKNYCANINQLQSRYLKIVGKLNDLKNGNSSKQSVQLPKIKLPEFDGEPRNWRAFVELFDKIVHNNPTISESIKMQYLKTNLNGKAAKMVEHLPPTESSYKTCYELLKNQYENERENVSSMIDEILDLERQNVETSAGLKLIHDKTFQCIMSIKSIGTSVDNWDVLLIQIIMRKLNEKTILDYESKLANVKKNQTLSYFLKYLENRYLALMSAETKTKSNVKNNNNYEKNHKNEKNMKKEITFQCTYCEKNHSIYRCESFLKLEPPKRVDWIKERKICVVCLQKHDKNECKSKFDCKTCNKKHNVLLHLEKRSKRNH